MFRSRPILRITTAFRLCLVLGGFLGLWAQTAFAHPDLQDALWIKVEPDRVRVAVDVSLREMLVAAGRTDEAIDFTQLALLAPLHQPYLSSHLTLSAGAMRLEGKVTGIRLPETIAAPEGTFVQFEFDYALPSPRPPALTVSQRMLIEWPYAVGVAWNVTYLTHVLNGASGQATRSLLTTTSPLTLPLPAIAAAAPAPQPERASLGPLLAEYARHGIDHILRGFDHLLFVGALVLAARTLLDLVKVVAAFTVAHSLTLALAVAGLVRLPSAVVEPAIALSIVFVALENLRSDAAQHPWRRLAVAFGFGLVHGLGFAGGLMNAMRAMPTSETWLALGAFSTGVEIGHQIVVLPLFGALVLARSRLAEPIPARLSRAASWAVSGGGAYFLVVALTS